MRLAQVALYLIVCVLLGGPVAADTLPRHGVLGAVLDDTSSGVTVRSVAAGSAAESAHLAAGDRIRAVGDAPIQRASEVVQLVRHAPAGTTLAFRVTHEGVARTVSVTVHAPRDESDPAVRTSYESIRVGDTLRRTLLDAPADARGPLPALLVIGGIGCFSVDVAANENDGYLRVARDVARAGFVTMRLEKSGVGDSQGPPCRTVDFRDESASYAVALEALRRNPTVDPAHIYLLGHSIGTLIAPRLALEQPVRGLIVSEAVGRPWFEYELANLRRQLVLGGDPPDVVDEKLASKEYCMHRLLIARDDEKAIEADRPDCATRNGIYPVDAPYLQQVSALNIIEPWTRLDVPVLALYGSADYVVAPDDHERIVAVVNAHHAGSATLERVDAMDHNLQVAATAQDFYRQAQAASPTRYQEDFSTSVLRWLCARERCIHESGRRDRHL